MTAFSIQTSTNIADIIEVNRRSAEAKEGIRIMELSTLSDLIPKRTAESIRKRLLERKLQVKQLTNQRVFEAWTDLPSFVETCLEVRYVSPETLPIQTELLLFDDTVAIYQIEPEVSVTIITHTDFAAQQKALFDNFWSVAKAVALTKDGSTTYAVTINRSPEAVFGFISNLANWPSFSDFAANFERVTDAEYIAHTPQGDIRVVAKFDRKRMLLDTRCILPDGTSDFIPYRVVPNKGGAELIMTNFRPKHATKAEYEEQLHWMDIELQRAKAVLEAKR